MNSGWECPRCGRGNSPYMLQCNCMPKPGEPSTGYSDNKFTINSDRTPEVVHPKMNLASMEPRDDHGMDYHSWPKPRWEG